jgi:hypothetical protein
MRYRIMTVFLVVMVIAIGFQISFVSAASIVEWKADYNDWSQEEQESITTVNTERLKKLYILPIHSICQWMVVTVKPKTIFKNSKESVHLV